MTPLISSPSLAITTTEPLLLPRTRALAEHLHLPLVTPEERHYPLLLTLTPERLELRETAPDGAGPLYVDFVGGALGFRRRRGVGRKQPLARAAGIRGDHRPTIFDATAGLGRDAFILAQLGCRVVLMERSPIIAALLRDGLERAERDDETAAIVARLEFRQGDSLAYMTQQTATERFDVVYLDPMHPPRRKSALVKKEMRQVRSVVGDDQEGALLLSAALSFAKRRVAVKRPRHALPLDGPEPHFTLAGEDTRFDLYLVAGQEETA